MIKKINPILLLLKLMAFLLAALVNGLALLSWLDVFLFGYPKDILSWGFLVANTLIGWVMIHICYKNWDFNIYNHYMDER